VGPRGLLLVLLSSCACRGRRLAGFGPPRVLEALTTRLLLEGRKATPCPSPSVPFGDWKTLSDRTRLRTRTVQLLVALNSALAIGVLLYCTSCGPLAHSTLGLGLQSARQTTSAALDRLRAETGLHFARDRNEGNSKGL
jgi:hypothetical protein